MTKKEKLETFSTERLEIIKRIIQTTPADEISRMINEIKKERKEKEQTNWNELYPVDDLVLDYSLVQLLKNNQIYSLQDLINADVRKIKGITSQDIQDIEWAKQFFDMKPLQNGRKKSELEVAQIVVQQAQSTDKRMLKKI